MAAAFLQAEQHFGLDLRRQPAQDDLVAAGHRGGPAAPVLKAGVCDLPCTQLLPPADVVRAAQSPPAVRLPVTGLSSARAEARQRKSPGMVKELRQRQAEPPALMLVGIAQPQPADPDRPRAAAHRADGLAAALGPRRPGRGELLHAQVAAAVSAPAGRAQLLRQQGLVLAASYPAGPEPQQGM